MTDREYASVIVVALLMVASGGVTYAGGQPAAVGSEYDTAEPVVDELLTRFDAGGEADAVYVDGSGDAVFYYENDHAVTAAVPIEGELGADAGTGLVRALYAGDLERITVQDRAATGNATMEATPESVTSSGTLAVDERDVESYSVDGQRTQTAETSSRSLTLETTLANETRLYESVETEGTLETTATTVSASGSVRTRVSDDRNGTDGPIALDERRNLTVTETNGTVRLEASERRTVGTWERDRWETEADARRSLENRYDRLAIGLGGEASLSLESYAFDNASDRETVEVAYTVAFTDVKDGLADRVVREFQTTADLELDEHESRVLSDRLAAASIEEVSVDGVQRGLETDLEWTAELRGTDGLVLGLAEIAGSNDRLADAWADRYDAVRADLEAQRGAGLVRRTEWNASIDHDRAAGQTTVDIAAESNAENWRRYVAEREDRGLGPVPETTATLTGTQSEAGLETRYEYETDRGGVGTASFEQLLRLADDDLGSTIDVAVAPLTDASFEVARIDATVDDGTVELESAAAFDGAPSLEGASGETSAAIHAVTEGERTEIYVTSPSAFGGDASTDEVRAHARVGPATDVYGPGEWDREFPSVDADAARSFLEVDDDSENRDGAGSSGTMLLGGVVLAALVAGGLCWISRRRRLDSDHDRTT
ncbi:hypothetical protein Htur_3079 [Haloterrigena turkmenica DSM 5511]|uniref:Uncharacterized protein n=1 Tax=Haloterrigena turkmenica (strain ATCC 51198 / DSM 5511 / JCM 9101 / NCIMB 13204 / VKM B-1734 / 4k) TaxID=543526 RepID=D2RYX6_HALTV|nr:hypothetical protein [Haloterrigena turkmenica]ADB61944.1 hypothetical protein Htur_3079 [Haloterrigena turkmenica DSM 5511]